MQHVHELELKVNRIVNVPLPKKGGKEYCQIKDINCGLNPNDVDCA